MGGCHSRLTDAPPRPGPTLLSGKGWVKLNTTTQVAPFLDGAGLNEVPIAAAEENSDEENSKMHSEQKARKKLS